MYDLGELKRGIALNSARTRIVNSTVSDGWNGPGPFTIANDRLQGAAENVMFAGATPSIPGSCRRTSSCAPT